MNNTVFHLIHMIPFVSCTLVACTAPVSPDVHRYDATMHDVREDQPSDVSQSDASIDAPAGHDAPTDIVTDQPSFDPDDAGPCDPRRIRARNSGRVCWPQNPDAPEFDCPGVAATCQLGVCCTGEIDPVTCDCVCPGSRPCNETAVGQQEYCCWEQSLEEFPDISYQPTCMTSCGGSFARARYWTEWAARRDR